MAEFRVSSKLIAASVERTGASVERSCRQTRQTASCQEAVHGRVCSVQQADLRLCGEEIVMQADQADRRFSEGCPRQSSQCPTG